jgi:protein-disulfide isomerase
MIRILLMASGFVLAFGGTVALADAVSEIQPGDQVLGSSSAPVTVIEYGSLDCPHCARWESEVFPKVKTDLIDAGKIRYVFRDFPLHGGALKAAELAHCEPDRYYAFVSVLFESQNSWAPRSLADDPVPELSKIAKLGGISDAKFQSCLADKQVEETIMTGRQKAAEAGVNSTPYFLVNGKPHAGEIPFDDLAQMIKDAAP